MSNDKRKQDQKSRRGDERHIAPKAPDFWQRVVWGIVTVAVVYAIYRVVALWWVCDDAFISFRYAKNLIDRHGLVFNVGERVEGYTNFLWTIIIALGMILKLDPVPISQTLGALSYFATVAIVGFLSWRLFSQSSIRAIFVPVAALCLLVCHDYHVFATSGLETSWTAMLITLGFALLVLGETRRSIVGAGLALVAAAMSRPDALMFTFLAVPYLWLLGSPRLRNILTFLAPLILIYLPYWIIRYNYYGYPFPNTYYAKSANLPYYSQGILYLWLFVKSYYVLLLLPLTVVAVLFSKRLRMWSLPVSEPVRRAILLSLLFIIPYSLYVVRSGGDFMFARFWILVLPIAFFLLELSTRAIFSKLRYLSLILLLLPAAVLARWNPYTTTNILHEISYEPSFYPASWMERARVDGNTMKSYFEGTDTKVAFVGLFACYVYYAEIPTAIEAATGLTDEFIAHQPITERGRPGHEKKPPKDYLLKRGVNFIFRGKVPMYSFSDSLKEVKFGNFDSYMLTYDVKLMNHLKQFKNVRFVDFPVWLDIYIPHLPEIPDATLVREYQTFKEYYFDQNADPERERPFLDRLSKMKPDQP